MASDPPVASPSTTSAPGASRSGLSRLLKDAGRRRIFMGTAFVVVALAAGLAYYEAVYVPAHAVQPETLQTTVARRGTIVLSAAGTGTLQAAQQADLAFKATGEISKLDVKVGDHVTEGQLLAELGNSTQQLRYQQAQQNLDSLTSVTAIGNAQKALATAKQQLRSAELQLEYLISPDVYYWENEIARDEKALKVAQSAADAAPADTAAQDNLKKAKDLVGFAEDKLKDAQKSYHDYVLDTFTVSKLNPQTQQQETTIEYPSPQEIVKTRQDIVIAQGAVDDAQNLYNALTGGHVQAGASGADLVALEQAQLDLQNAKQNLEDTQLHAPFSGTVVAVTAQVGPVSAVPTPVGNITTTIPVRSTSILTIADMSSLDLETYVDESDYDKFKIGNSANIVFDALPDRTFTGKVVQIDPALSTSSGSAVVSGLVELDRGKADLLLGMTASVDVIAAQAQNVVVIPISALHEYAPGKYAVFVLKDGKLTPQLVEVGLEDLVNAEIKSGLQVGDVVSTGLQASSQQ